MAATIETRVRELVSAIMRRVEAEVEDAFERAISDELAQRRNGHSNQTSPAQVVDDVDVMRN